MSSRFSCDDAKMLGDKLGVDWKSIDVDQFRKGMEVELEHGIQDPATDVTKDDALLTAKLAWAHLKKIPDYYDRLEDMTAEGEAYWEAAQTG